MTLTLADIALLTAVEAADSSTVSQCLQQGADINAISQNGWTPLMLAVLHGSAETVKLLLEQGADLNLATQSEENPSRTALAVAVSNGRLDAVQALVAHDVNIHKRDYSGLTPVELAEKLALRPFHQDQMAAIASFLREKMDSNVRRSLEIAAA